MASTAVPRAPPPAACPRDEAPLPGGTRPPSQLTGQRVVGDYQVCGALGAGASSEVRLVRHRVSGEEFAAKIIAKGHGVIEVRRENILKQVNHENVVFLHKVLESSNNFYIILEAVRGGDLCQTILEAEPQTMAIEETRRIFRQVLCGVAACHLRGIAHRDLKPENILLTEDGTVKISDFGMSHFHKESANVALRREYANTTTGTRAYMAPEVMSPPYDAFKADIWSLGCILYIMLTSRFPFGGDVRGAEFERRLRAGEIDELPSSLPADAQTLVRALLSPRPDQRPTLKEIAEAPFLQQAGLPPVALPEPHAVRPTGTTQGNAAVAAAAAGSAPAPKVAPRTPARADRPEVVPVTIPASDTKLQPDPVSPAAPPGKPAAGGGSFVPPVIATEASTSAPTRSNGAAAFPAAVVGSTDGPPVADNTRRSPAHVAKLSNGSFGSATGASFGAAPTASAAGAPSGMGMEKTGSFSMLPNSSFGAISAALGASPPSIVQHHPPPGLPQPPPSSMLQQGTLGNPANGRTSPSAPPGNLGGASPGSFAGSGSGAGFGAHPMSSLYRLAGVHTGNKVVALPCGSLPPSIPTTLLPGVATGGSVAAAGPSALASPLAGAAGLRPPPPLAVAPAVVVQQIDNDWDDASPSPLRGSFASPIRGLGGSGSITGSSRRIRPEELKALTPGDL